MSSTKWNSEIKALFHETKIRYPHQQLEPETVRAYLQDWRELCEQVGLRRFTEAVRRARSYTKFIPMISEIRPMVPEADEVGEERKSLADENCQTCQGTSWESFKTERGNTMTKRCKCWLANRAKLTA